MTARMDPSLALAALLSLYPHAVARPCVEAHRPQIVAALARGEHVHGVPPEILLSVAWAESWAGCHPASGGCWGAPISPLHRHTAGTADHAARALATSYRVCGTWERAVSRFRMGLCVPRRPEHAAYVRAVMRLAERIAVVADVPREGT